MMQNYLESKDQKKICAVSNATGVGRTKQRTVSRIGDEREMAKKQRQLISRMNKSNISQRKVVLTTDSPRKTDSVEYNSINFGNVIAGGDFQEFKKSNFNALPPGEKIAMVGHGKPGSSGHHSGSEIAGRLTGTDGKGKGMPDGSHDIIFTSCYASSTKSPGGHQAEVSKSVIETVKSAVSHKWPGATFNIKGADGPSLKTLDGGNQELWAVINDTHLSLAGDMQDELNTIYGVKIKDEVIKDPNDSEFEAAGKVAADRKDYFLDFIYLVKKDWANVSEKSKIHLRTLSPATKLGEYIGKLDADLGTPDIENSMREESHLPETGEVHNTNWYTKKTGFYSDQATTKTKKLFTLPDRVRLDLIERFESSTKVKYNDGDQEHVGYVKNIRLM